MFLKKNKRTIALLLSLVGLAGCGPLIDLGSNTPIAARYRLALENPAPPPVEKLNAAKIILVDDLVPPADLATDRLAIRLGAQEVRYLAAMRWTDRPGRMMRELMSAYGQNIEGLTILAPTQLDIRYDFRLSGRLESFHVVITPGKEPMAYVAFQAVLTQRAAGNTVAIESFSAQAPAQNDSVVALTAAINKAANQAAGQALHWAVKNMD
jgi:ABC-type uncharacterized transport system auxiliary subunit